MLRVMLLLTSTLFLAATAGATPLRYDFVSGSASVGVKIDGRQILSAGAALDGSFVVYDAMALTIDDFELTTTDNKVPLPFGSLAIDLTAKPGSGYVSGPGTTSTVELGPVAIVLDAVLSTFFPIPFGLDLMAKGPVGVDVSVAGNMAKFDVSEMLFSFTKFRKDFEVSLGVQFVGKTAGPAIPEPTSVLLFLVGVGAVGLVIRRQRLSSEVPV